MTIDRQAIVDACESPIEAILIPALVEGFHDGVQWEQQRQMRCGADLYRADLWASFAGRSVVIEADGKAYHDYRDDQLRDLRMMVRGGVTDVLRFTGGCIVGDPDGCQAWARRYLPHLFDRDAHPRTAEGLTAASTSLRGTYAKPTLRSRQNPVAGPVAGGETWMALAQAGDGVVWEYRWPYAGRGGKSRPSPLADALTSVTWGWQSDDRDFRREVASWNP